MRKWQTNPKVVSYSIEYPNVTPQKSGKTEQVKFQVKSITSDKDLYFNIVYQYIIICT
jgi:hypothetical protein